MFFRRKQRETKVLYNSDKRIVFVCLNGQVQVSHLELLLNQREIGYSIVTEYYQMDLTTYNVAIITTPDAIQHFTENKHCYYGLQIYLVVPRGAVKPDEDINTNIVYLEHNDKRILDIIFGMV